MSQTPQIEIVTIYNTASTSGARSRIRTLAIISVLAAGIWLWGVHYKADPWIGKVLIASYIGNAMSSLPSSPDQERKLTPEQLKEQRLQAKADGAKLIRQGAIRTAEMYIWLGIAYVAGGWLALAGLVGVLGGRVSLRMQRQAALLMILSTIASIAGIWVAIKWGGMPPLHLEFYAKIGAVQSSYAWFLLIGTRLVR